ncbi:hypothetical protein ACTQ3Z_00880 [Lawsonibacter sp. LCP25S3_F5]
MVEHGSDFIYHDISKSFFSSVPSFLLKQRRPVIPGGVVPCPDI